MLGLLGAIQNIGSLGSLPFAPYVSEGLGRKKAIFFGAAVMIAGAALQAAAQNVRMFIGARFLRKCHPPPYLQAIIERLLLSLVGFGLGFATNAAPMLVTELAYP